MILWKTNKENCKTAHQSELDTGAVTAQSTVEIKSTLD